MVYIQSRVVGAGLFFLFIFATGFLVSRSGKPYGALIFTAHKLIGLAVGIFLGFTVYRTHQLAPLNPIQSTAILLTVLLFILTVAAGGLLSTQSTTPPVVSLMHRVSPYLIVFSTAATLYLLLYHEA